MGEVLAVIIADRGGPGEREEALSVGRRHLRKAGVEVDQIVRIDVPPTRGGGGSSVAPPEPRGVFRPELSGIVPLLQSFGLFGQKQGVLVVDAHWLAAAEAKALAELISAIDPEAVAVAMVAQRRLPAPLTAVIKETGKSVTVRPLWENQVHGWLAGQIKTKGLRLGYEARTALVQRFGTDRAALERAMQQLQGENRPITAEMIVKRFRNRPDQPVFRILDEIVAGNTQAGLRRLGDYLANARPSDGRPHILLGTLESDLRLRLLAAQAADRDHFGKMEETSRFSRMLESAPGPLDAGAQSKLRTTARGRVKSSQKRLDRIWNQRKPFNSVTGAPQVRAAQHALSLLVAADRTLKLFPAPLHRTVLERTVAQLCGIYPSFCKPGFRR